MRTSLALALALAAAPAAAQQEAPPAVLPLAAPMTFACTDGRAITIDIDQAAGVARLLRDGEVQVLMEQVGRVPRRFVTGSVSLDLDEKAGTAVIRLGAGNRSDTRATCRRLPAEPTPGVIWGTLTKMDRMALVPGTRARVFLVDAARQGAPAIEIASTTIVTRGNQVPLHFRIDFPPERVTPRPMTYRLQARLEFPGGGGAGARGGLTHITDTVVPVLEASAAQPPVELKLVPVGGR
ncbi:MAG: YbaY family lipoprotein [Sphingomonadaceae bacterium]